MLVQVMRGCLRAGADQCTADVGENVLRSAFLVATNSHRRKKRA